MVRKSTDDIYDIHEHGLNLGGREIYLYDEIDCDSAMKFIKNMNILEQISSKPIVIHQYSVGGEWAAGMAIYDTILFCSSPIVFITHGCAASMGSIIPQAVYGKGYRVSSPGCDWLIHEGYLSLDNTSRAASSIVDAEKRTKAKMYDIYTASCQSGEYFKDQSPNKIKSYIRSKLAAKEDWWITSEEAVYYGLADAVLGTKGYETIKGIVNSI